MNCTTTTAGKYARSVCARRTARRSPYEHIVKGYEVEKDRYVVLDDEDFEAVPGRLEPPQIDIVQFVDVDRIEPGPVQEEATTCPGRPARRPSAPPPGGGPGRPVGIAKSLPRQGAHRGAPVQGRRVRPGDDVLARRVREADFGGVDVDIDVREHELAMARQLIDSLTTEWNPAEFTDEYREALLRDRRGQASWNRQGDEIEVLEPEPTAKVVDLMEALKASVAAAKQDVDDGSEAAAGSSRSKKPSGGAKKTASEEDGSEEDGIEEAGGSQEGRRGIDAGAPTRLHAATDRLNRRSRGGHAAVPRARPRRRRLPGLRGGLILDAWRNPYLHGAWLAFGSDGEPAGYVEVESDSTRRRPWTRGCRSIPGTVPDRCAELCSGSPRTKPVAPAAGAPTRFWTSGAATDATFVPTVMAAGFHPIRTFWHMERPLEFPPIGPIRSPEASRFAEPAPNTDQRRVFEVMDEAFRGHFGFEPVRYEDWRAANAESLAEPWLVLLAEVQDVPAGAVTNRMPGGTGWINDLGVRPAFRGRGIGSSLLQGSFAELAERGATQVRLNVDSENETGATRLYASVGMTVRRGFLVFEKLLDA